MDSWETRYTHMGVEYVTDHYSGRTIPADVHDAIHSAVAGAEWTARANAKALPGKVKKHPLLRKQVKFMWGAKEVIGKVTQMEYGSRIGYTCKIKVAGSSVTYYLTDDQLTLV